MFKPSYWCGDDGDGDVSADYKDADDDDGEAEYKEEPWLAFWSWVGPDRSFYCTSLKLLTYPSYAQHTPNVDPM